MVGLNPVIPIVPRNRERVQAQLIILVKLNGLYRQLVWLWDRMHCQRTCAATVIASDAVAISTQMNIVRTTQPAARLTYVINHGDQPVIIYESQAPVALALPEVRVDLPLPGRGRIWARSFSGEQPIRIVTVLNCDCGVTAAVDDYNNPVGAFLL